MIHDIKGVGRMQTRTHRVGVAGEEGQLLQHHGPRRLADHVPDVVEALGGPANEDEEGDGDGHGGVLWCVNFFGGVAFSEGHVGVRTRRVRRGCGHDTMTRDTMPHLS